MTEGTNMICAECQAEYAESYRCSTESDWLQERMDKKLQKSCGEHFVPFRARNPYIKQFNYHRRKKGNR